MESYLKEIGITPQKETIKKKDAIFLEEKKQNEIIYYQRVKTYKARQLILEQHYQESLLSKSETNERAVEDITFEIINEQVTGVTPQFYEFDIMVSGSSSNTYLDNSAFKNQKGIDLDPTCGQIEFGLYQFEQNRERNKRF